MSNHPALRRSAAVGLVLFLAAGVSLRAESAHVFGIHFWDWGAGPDVMSQRTGWVVEAAAIGDGSAPNVSGRYNPATGGGFTVLQRLDWRWDQTIPLLPADQDVFAQQCASWASAIRHHCRHYSIGNEVEFFGVTPAIYASCFQKVRAAIRAVQPEALVIIGHMNNSANQQSVMQIVGPDGHDGVTVHTPSSVPTEHLDMLDQENAHPGAGVYITEWGWVINTNPSALDVIRDFYLGLGASNASRARQVYCACWYIYPDFLPDSGTFSLKLSTIDNPAFEAATALGTSVNSLANTPVVISDLAAEVPDAGNSLVVRWNTTPPARTQLWWSRYPLYGAGNENVSVLDPSLTVAHQASAAPLAGSTVYEVMPSSTRPDCGDAGGRRYRVKTGPWSSQVVRSGPASLTVSWTTDWPADSRVEYGPDPGLGQVAADPALVTAHAVVLENVPPGVLHYRAVSGEPAPPGAPGLSMCTPVRSVTVKSWIPGDWDQDGDVDLYDFGRFQACLSGLGIPQEDPGCFLALLDDDGDVDAGDTAILLDCLTGPGVAGSPGCSP